MAVAGALDASSELPDHMYQRRWITLAVLCVSLLVIVMDNTILNVAIPSLVEDLGATNSQLQWIIDSYTLVFAGLLLTTGSMGDRFGRKRALRAGIMIFCAGSALSALAGSPTQLIVTRGLMGIGGALIMPSTLSILTNVFRDPRERGRAIAIWAGFSGLAVAIGPITGGILLAHFHWSSVFWVNIPIGIAAIVLGHYFIPESKDPNAPKLDLPGAVLSIVGLGALLFGIIQGPAAGWTAPSVVIGFVLGVVGLSAFIAWELYTPTPMLDMKFFKNPRFTAANSSITLTFFAMFGSMFLLTQYWQFVHGYTPLEAGVRMVPFAMGMMITAPLSARLVEIVGTKRVVTLGLVVVAGSMFFLSFITVDSSYLRVIVNYTLVSVGMGLTMPPATESVMGSLPREKAGVGSAVNDTTRQVGGALGVAVIGSIVASVYAGHIADAAPSLGLSGAALDASKGSLGGALDTASSMGANAAGLTDTARVAFVDALHAGLRLGAAVVGVAAVLAYMFLPARAPAEQPELLPAVDLPEERSLAPAIVD
jgi:EmrB/QacA subfamily drug resistance transporter